MRWTFSKGSALSSCLTIKVQFRLMQKITNVLFLSLMKSPCVWLQTPCGALASRGLISDTTSDTHEGKWLCAPTHLKPVEHGSDVWADSVCVVNCIRVELLSQRQPIHHHNIGLIFPLHHCRNQLPHPGFKHATHLGKRRKSRRVSLSC